MLDVCLLRAYGWYWWCLPLLCFNVCWCQCCRWAISALLLSRILWRCLLGCLWLVTCVVIPRLLGWGPGWTWAWVQCALLVLMLLVLLPLIFLLSYRYGCARWCAWCSGLPWWSSWCIALLGLQFRWHRIQLQLMIRLPPLVFVVQSGCRCQVARWQSLLCFVLSDDILPSRGRHRCSSQVVVVSCHTAWLLVWCWICRLWCLPDTWPDVVVSSGLWCLVVGVLLQVLLFHDLLFCWLLWHWCCSCLGGLLIVLFIFLKLFFVWWFLYKVGWSCPLLWVLWLWFCCPFIVDASWSIAMQRFDDCHSWWK